MSALPPTVDDSPIWDIWLSQFRLPIINVNCEVGTFAALSDGVLTTDELAQKLALDARALAMHLAALCSMGLVEKRLGKWRATHLARTWLHPEGTGYWGSFCARIDSNQSLTGRLLASLKTGRRADEIEDADNTAPRPAEWERGTMQKRLKASPVSCMPTVRPRHWARRRKACSAR